MKLIKMSLIALTSLIIVSSCNNQSAGNTETETAETLENKTETPDMHTSKPPWIGMELTKALYLAQIVKE